MIIVKVSTVNTPLAAGQSLGDWKVDILDAAGSVVLSQTAASTSVTFPTDPAPGNYKASAQRLDSTGALFGAVQTSSEFAIVEMGESAGPVSVTVS